MYIHVYIYILQRGEVVTRDKTAVDNAVAKEASEGGESREFVEGGEAAERWILPVKASAPVYRQTLDRGTVEMGLGQSSFKLPSLERNRSTSVSLRGAGEYAGPSAQAAGVC
jgi:hypothetical protein